jgi:hypothetical protein
MRPNLKFEKYSFFFKMCSIIILKLSFLIFSNLFSLPVLSNPVNGNDYIFPILMPRVKPKLPVGESYLCTAVKTDPGTNTIKLFSSQ